MAEYTSEFIDSVVPERYRGSSFEDLPPGLKNLVQRRFVDQDVSQPINLE